MRDVTEDDEAAIPRRERFTPEAIVVRLPEWRKHADGSGEMLVEKTGEWGKIHPMFVATLEALRDGLPFLEALARAEAASPEIKPNHVRIFLRRFYWQLAQGGHLRLPFEEPPAVFEGRYRRVKELGRGGIGVAHLCEDIKENERAVVIKHAWGYQSPIERADRSMRKEGEVLRALDHPGIVRFYDEFEVEGLYHVVREYVDGTPLERVAKKEKPDAAARRGILREIVGILSHMHEKGYLFLDAKPDNFLRRLDGSLVVADVGTCRAHKGGLALAQGQAGSRGYAAPEVIARENIGVWSDVYSLGCVHQFLLTRRQPAHNATREERLAALADAPEDERALILACTDADPGARPSLAKILASLV